MILSADEPAVVRKFDNLHKMGRGILSDTLHTGSLEACAVIVVELEAVAVTLAHFSSSVGLCGA